MQKSFDTLTGLRGILALWVVFHHVKIQIFYLVDPWAAHIADLGYISVDFFFVLSGFVIAMTHQREFTKKFSYQNLKSFYIKRFARIYPLHFSVMILYLSLPLIYLLSGRSFLWIDRFEPSTFFTSILLINNWGFHNVLSWNVPSWSISTEFASYLLFPFITYCVYRIRGLFLLFCLIVFNCGIIGCLFKYSGATNIGSSIPSLGIWRCFLEFNLGMVVFNLYCYGFFSYFGRKYLLTGMLLILSIGISMTLTDYYWVPLFMVFFVGFFISLESTCTIKVPNPVLWLGKISYTVYLIHYFIRDVMKLFLETEQASWTWLLTYFILLLFISHLVYKFYELPMKRYILSKYLPKKIQT